MSPTEDVRQQTLAFLADPQTGLNPEFIAACANRSIEVPVPSYGGTDAAPFDFQPLSQNVFLINADIDWLNSRDKNVPVNYPALMLYGESETQSTSDRPLGSRFYGDVSIGIRCYLAWLPDDVPVDNNYEAPIDALQDAFFAVLTRDTNQWQSPVLFRNMLTVRERIRLGYTPDGRLLRSGIRFSLSAKYVLLPFHQ